MRPGATRRPALAAAASAALLTGALAGCASVVPTAVPAAATAIVGAGKVALPLAPGADVGRIDAYWFPLAAAAGAATDAQRRPAAVALHGCGGLWRRDGRGLEARYVEYVARLHAAGYHVLLPDSFAARGSGPICTLPAPARRITPDTRRADVAAALRWLAARPEVDASRLVVLGWSHGAMTALAAIDAARPDAARPAAAAVFYPGCAALLRRDYRLAQPLLMLLGAADDWTPAARCERFVERLRQRQPQAPVTLRVYADSYHGFDGRGPLRWRSDVHGGTDPAGVHVGGNPAARAAALDELDRFLAQIREGDPHGSAARVPVPAD